MGTGAFFITHWDKLLTAISWLWKKLRNIINRNKNKIAQLEKEKVDIQRAHSEEMASLKQQISELERKTRAVDEVPEGFEVRQNNLLVDKKTGRMYCWNCWNKIEGRERRVLVGDEYDVECMTCKTYTKIKERPLPRRTYDDGDNAGFRF